MRKRKCLWLSGSALAIGGSILLPAGGAWAQAAAEEAAGPVDEEIIVTAQRREERSVDVPISVASLSSEQLAAANVQDLSDIAEVTTAVRFDNQGQFVQPSIRGIGTGITTAGGGSNVGIYIDGFYSPNPAAADLQLLNVNSIQVLKGPQGTLFGRNTTGGAILVQSAEPRTETAANGRISYGRFNEVRAQGYITQGLSDSIAFDLEGLYTYGDHFQRNIATGRRDAKFRNWSIRTGLKIEFSPAFSALLRYQHGDVNDPSALLENTYVDPDLGPAAPNFAPPSAFTTDPDFYAPGANRRKFQATSDIGQLTLRADLGFADLTSYTQYRKEDTDASLDLDHTALTVFQLGLPVENETWTQELLLSSASGPRLQYTAGLFYFNNRDRYITFIDNAVPPGPRIRQGGSEAPTSSYAAFVDLTYELNPKLFITAGARYSHDVIKDAYYNIGTTEVPVDDIEGDRITPRLVLRYKPSDQASVYASYTKGYKAAILDVGGSCQIAPDFICTDVKPETIDAYEIGAKFSRRGLSLEAAAYYYDYKNLQVSLFLGQGQASIVNAATSAIYGVEGSLQYRVSDAFDFNIGAAYTHGRYKRFENAPIYRRCPTAAGCGFGSSFFVETGTTLEDVTMQRTPSFTGNAGARYQTDLAGGRFELAANLYYSSSFFFGPSGIQFPQEAYEVLSARAQWTDPSDTFSLAVWGDNLTDSRYRTQVQYNAFGIGSSWSEPVTYGVEIGFRF